MGRLKSAAAVSAGLEATGKDGARTRAADVLDRLRHDISESRFLPGQRLHLEELSNLYGVGFSPIREALSRLAVDELVVLSEFKGYRVAPISKQDWLDILMMRAELESLGLALSMQHGDELWRKSVKDCIDDLTRQERHGDTLDLDWEERHRAFHSCLIAACGSPWLLRFSSLLAEQSARYLRLSLPAESSNVSRDHVKEHVALAEAVMEGDVMLATALLRNHLNRTRLMVLGASSDLFLDSSAGKAKASRSKKIR